MLGPWVDISMFVAFPFRTVTVSMATAHAQKYTKMDGGITQN